MTNEYILECENLVKTFETNSGTVKATDNVTLKLKRGECYGLVGESGCGKSTLSSLLSLLKQPDSGKMFFDGKEIFNGNKTISNSKIKQFRRHFQIIFQDPYSSLNPKMKIETILEEPLIIHKIGKSKEERKRLVNEIRMLTGLPLNVLEKYPSELSGGQRQRVAIASAMILKPDFVICDECVSSLDVLIQAQILNLLKSMQESMNLTYLFISHNLNVVAYMADRIGVMYKGKIVEENTTSRLLKNPEHPYTKKLLLASGLLQEQDMDQAMKPL